MLRVLLVQTAQGLNPSSGGFKANANVLRSLAAHGHEAAQICYGHQEEIELHVKKAEDKGIDPDLTVESMVAVDLKGFVHKLPIKCFTDEYKVDTRVYLERNEASQRMQSLVQLFSEHITKFQPTHVVFNDPITMKLTAEHAERATFKRINIIHTAEQLPFGPFAAGVDGHCMSPAVEDALLRGLDGIWSVSKAIQDYAWTYGKLKTTFLTHPIATYLDKDESGMPVIPPVRNNIDKDEVGMVNPCAQKGLSILIELARRLPHIKFVVWKSWGSRRDHLAQLEGIPNLNVVPTTKDTNEIWDRIKVLIAPSVWFEAWGIVVTEAQLRGIPVISSDAGGLPEAKMHIPYIIPVNTVTGEREANRDYVIPQQDITPWVETVNKVMTDRDEYRALQELTVTKSAEWLRAQDLRGHEKWFLSMMDAQ
ncbi:hypothetical protein VTJ49DRAFT_5052 [Mycothermus thermophilus]|uniref:Glycosyl transferase family 1 domain-containing protein n=1 Tax=Humicola insolens TaxID=85995 RepID=A0ABR3V421_HUMIN